MKRVLLALIVGAIVALFVFGKTPYRNSIIAQAAGIAGSDLTCFFDGHYIQGDVPVAVLLPEGTAFLSPFADLRDTFLNSEMAKPFHFGIVVIRNAGTDAAFAEPWGWSYRETAFWQDGAFNPFDLAYTGDPVADCERALVGG
ncbi:hypothetical protein AB3Y40_01020 [Yoonia sp. R2331]|uniref:hypothetical protein n=1 Tax=Yoonia sp. R2331 TaxID=3237238 RepID=UPI0034E57EE2